MNKSPIPDLKPNQPQLIAKIYDIAMEPSQLSDFIETWHAAWDDSIGLLDFEIGTHLDRAQVFMGSVDLEGTKLLDQLKPFEGMTAFIADASGQILSANTRALTRLGATQGATLEDLQLDHATSLGLRERTEDVFRAPDLAQRIFRAGPEDGTEAMLVRVTALQVALGEPRSALIVLTDFQWNASIDRALHSAFGLTKAEQGVVQMLVNGQEARTIARLRCVQEGTVRGQIKSILSKMGLRSKTDLIRLVMPLVILPDEAADAPAPNTSQNWLEEEVLKPFSSFQTEDGRRLTYHQMGPPDGDMVLMSHMGSCMVRWPKLLLRKAFELKLRIICPIRAGYGDSDPHDPASDLFAATRADTLSLLDHLGVKQLPYAVQGTDFPLAIDFASKHPERITSIIGIGGKPCLPDGASIRARGDWQQFFVRAAARAPKLSNFASAAVMAMSRQIGSAKMLSVLCKDSVADLALIEDPEMAAVLRANLDFMARKDSHAASAFAREYIAFYSDWSDRMQAIGNKPIHVFLADQDPTSDLADLPKLEGAYPWVTFEVVENAGLALMFQHFEVLMPVLKNAAKVT